MEGPIELDPPWNMVVCGAGRAGKTVFVKTLLTNLSDLQPTPFSRIIYCYSTWQPLYAEMERDVPLVEFHRGVCHDHVDALENATDEQVKEMVSTLIVLDDMLTSAVKAHKAIASLFTRLRHTNTSVIYITQDIFHDSKNLRSASRSAAIIVLFNNPRDKTIVRTLNTQMFPEKPRFLQDAQRQVLELDRYGYLFIQLLPTVPEELRVTWDIFSLDHVSCFLPI